MMIVNGKAKGTRQMKVAKFVAVSAAMVLGFGLTSPLMAVPIPGDIATADGNDGVQPIYGSDSQSGVYGANWKYTGNEDLEVDIIFLGREAGFDNSFWFNGVKLFNNGSIAQNVWDTGGSLGVVTTTIAAFTGIIDFYFETPNGQAVNGSNPDNTTSNDVNFFSYYNEGSTYLDVWLDDGNDSDDNHDDMAIRINWDGDRSLERVPEISAAGSVAALGTVAALMLFLMERRGGSMIGRRSAAA